ncbi:hypothetical protein JW935_25805 [candidate division KSB1 bacterium]|nr:hypothetical protein [candidate division KSB1 bacterium]
MNDNIAKSISTLGVWGATAAILIWSHFRTAAPVEILVLLVAGFSTAVIWNYKITNILRPRDEKDNRVNDEMYNT